MISDSRSAAATCLGTRSAPRPWSHGSDMVGEADWTVSLRCRSKSYSIVGWTYRSQAPLGGAPSTHARVLNEKQVRCCKKASDARYAAATLPTDSILDEITRIQVLCHVQWQSCRAFRVTFSRDSMRITQSNADRRTPPRPPESQEPSSQHAVRLCRRRRGRPPRANPTRPPPAPRAPHREIR